MPAGGGGGHYAVKANPHPRLLACLHAAGCRFEAASWAEVRAVIRASADPATVLFTHPVKTADDIARAMQDGVWRFDAEATWSCTSSPGTPRGPRCCCGWTRAPANGRRPGQVRHPPGKAPQLARLARSLGLNPYGLAFHVGSQTMDPTAWHDRIRRCAQIMTALAADGIKLAMLDVGGGFPVRYDTDPPPVSDYAAAISDAAAHLPYPVNRPANQAGRSPPRPDNDHIGGRRGLATRNAAGQPGHRRVPRPDRSARIRPTNCASRSPSPPPGTGRSSPAR